MSSLMPGNWLSDDQVRYHRFWNGPQEQEASDVHISISVLGVLFKSINFSLIGITFP